MATYKMGDVVALTIFGTDVSHRYLYFVESTEILKDGTEMLTAHWIDNNGTAERMENKLVASMVIPYSGPINQERYCRR